MATDMIFDLNNHTLSSLTQNTTPKSAFFKLCVSLTDRTKKLYVQTLNAYVAIFVALLLYTLHITSI